MVRNKLDDPYGQDPQHLKRLTINLPSGGKVPLSSVADVVDGSGPNTINRENVRRRKTAQV
jgi:HME family heavy-metal exporter